MSIATARPSGPTAATRPAQSVREPGLPCTKTAASRACSGPASITGEVTEPTPMRRSRVTSARPRRADPIEGVLVVRDPPALRDLAICDAKDAHRSPRQALALVLASREDHRALGVGDHAAHLDPQGG